MRYAVAVTVTAAVYVAAALRIRKADRAARRAARPPVDTLTHVTGFDPVAEAERILEGER